MHGCARLRVQLHIAGYRRCKKHRRKIVDCERLAQDQPKEVLRVSQTTYGLDISFFAPTPTGVVRKNRTAVNQQRDKHLPLKARRNRAFIMGKRKLYGLLAIILKSWRDCVCKEDKGVDLPGVMTIAS